MVKKADILIYNAKLYDPIKGKLPADALAVRDGKIQQIGSKKDLPPAATELNLQGRPVLPTLCDSHTHFVTTVRRRQEINLEDCNSLAEALAKIRQRVEAAPEGEWITGGGWNQNNWTDNPHPTRQHLDAISTRHFIALDSKDWHTMWVNTPVLEKAGIDPNRPYPGAKHLAIHPETGEFTGILEEEARIVIFGLIPPPAFSKLKNALEEVQAEYHRFGYGSIHTVEPPDETLVLGEALFQNKLQLRSFWYVPVKHLTSLKQHSVWKYLTPQFLELVGIKLFLDGAFGSQSAELLDNYENLGHAGTGVMDEKTLARHVETALNHRLACAIHAIGDKAIRKAINVLEQVEPESRRHNLHHRIEHAQLIQPQDLKRFSAIQLTASMQPLHLAYDIPIMKKYLGNRAEKCYAFNSLQRAGVRLIFGSDSPVESFNPWKAIYTALQRKEGLDPLAPVFNQGECLSLWEAIKAYTLFPAETVNQSNSLGKIQAGYQADFFVADRNIFEIPPEELPETKSLLTVVNGQIVHRTLD